MNFFLWSRVHRLPRVFIERWQVAQLRRVVGLALHHVPAYRELFDRRQRITPFAFYEGARS